MKAQPLIDPAAADATIVIYEATDADISDPLGYGCPIFGGELTRTHRRVVDRPLSLVVPVRRFRCSTLQCGTEGNLRV